MAKMAAIATTKAIRPRSSMVVRRKLAKRFPQKKSPTPPISATKAKADVTMTNGKPLSRN